MRMVMARAHIARQLLRRVGPGYVSVAIVGLCAGDLGRRGLAGSYPFANRIRFPSLSLQIACSPQCSFLGGWMNSTRLGLHLFVGGLNVSPLRTPGAGAPVLFPRLVPRRVVQHHHGLSPGGFGFESSRIGPTLVFRSVIDLGAHFSRCRTPGPARLVRDRHRHEMPGLILLSIVDVSCVWRSCCGNPPSKSRHSERTIVVTVIATKGTFPLDSYVVDSC